MNTSYSSLLNDLQKSLDNCTSSNELYKIKSTFLGKKGILSSQFNEMRNISFDASDVLSLDGSMLPLEFALGQNYPNPFNPTTKIQYALANDAFVNISIYDLMGRSIKSLINIEQAAGFYEINWDATNNNGELVPAGMYFYMIQAGTFKSTKKMVLLK